MFRPNKKILLLTVVFIFLKFAFVGECNVIVNTKVENTTMKPCYIGRFSIDVPTEMITKIRSAQIRYVQVFEVPWPKNIQIEKARSDEWASFKSNLGNLSLPDGAKNIIIKRYDFSETGRWSKGIFFHDENDASDEGTWRLLFDADSLGVWLKSRSVIVEKDLSNSKVVSNFTNIAKAYQPLTKTTRSTTNHISNGFYLQDGIINLPFSWQEESVARFEGHPLDLTLLVEMEADCTKEIESMGLIDKTKAMLAAALVTHGGSISKVRLQKREVAGMPGEEAVLKVREGNDTQYVFTWEFNGKDDSGEYPTTRINMESPEGQLDEKLKIWDAILDSMKPMFVRK